MQSKAKSAPDTGCLKMVYLSSLTCQIVNGLHRVDFAGVYAVSGAKCLGEFEFFVVQVHRDDGISAGNMRAHHGRQAYAAHAEDNHALARLYFGGVDHGARAGHHRAADDGGDIPFDTRVDLHHILLIAQGVVGPGEYIFRDRNAIADFQLCCHRWPFGRFGCIAWHPGHQHGIAFAYVGYIAAGFQHHTGGFMAQNDWISPRTVHLVQL